MPVKVIASKARKILIQFLQTTRRDRSKECLRYSHQEVNSILMTKINAKVSSHHWLPHRLSWKNPSITIIMTGSFKIRKNSMNWRGRHYYRKSRLVDLLKDAFREVRPQNWIRN